MSQSQNAIDQSAHIIVSYTLTTGLEGLVYRKFHDIIMSVYKTRTSGQRLNCMNDETRVRINLF